MRKKRLLDLNSLITDIRTGMKANIATLIAVIILLSIFISVPGFSDGYTVLLKNSEDNSFYYIVDPAEISVFDPAGSIFVSVLFDYFAEGQAQFKSLSSKATNRLENLSEGSHMLVGFFKLPGSNEYPVRVLKFRAGEGIDERTYIITREPTLLYAKASRGKLKDFAVEETAAVSSTVTSAKQEESQPEKAFSIKIDNQYEDWEDVPFVKSFSDSYKPVSFTREQYGGTFEVFSINQAEHWQDGGTSINELKAVSDIDAIYLFISTHSFISENMSILFYLHSTRTLGTDNKMTLELVPAAGTKKPGVVVLWRKDDSPKIIGKVASGGFFLEASISKNDLVSYLDEYTTLDMTSCYFDRPDLFYEEFFFTTLRIDDFLSY